MNTTRPKLLILAKLVISILAIFATLSATTGVVASQEISPDPTTVTVSGHGFGHGRGMSQYGALGYAIDFGWSSDQILDHYYGDTSAGWVESSLLTIRLESASGEPTVAQVDSGAMVLLADDGTVTHLGASRAIRLTAVSGGFAIADAPTCSGPFTDRPGVFAAEQVRLSSTSGQPSGGSGTVGTGKAVVGDWDGDGDDEVATASGTSWTLYSDTINNPASSVRTTFTMPEGLPVAGDWDGDGDDTAGVFNNGQWSLGNGQDLAVVEFGQAGDTPVVGDWDGDGNDDLGVRRGNTWILSPGGGAETIQFTYGTESDTPLVGDWDGDGIDDVGVVRDQTWLRRTGLATPGPELEQFVYSPGAKALVGDWDGDGIDQPGRQDGQAVSLHGQLAKVNPRLDPDLPTGQTIQRCVSSSEQRYYRGELRAVHNDGDQRTVNAVDVEWYLRSVVPREMPASWALLGDGAGAEALKTQAVSARSYALGEDRASYATTCDTISCQVYDGRATRTNGSISSNEHTLSNVAISQTTGVVRFRDGEVARTEFSSSTGGWSAGGEFPAVEDLGDAVEENPNHDWETTISISSLESRFGGSSLDRVFASEKNGLGEGGGRVLEVTFVAGDESFTMTGNDFRFAFGLKSDWFSLNWNRDGGQVSRCICPVSVPAIFLDE